MVVQYKDRFFIMQVFAGKITAKNKDKLVSVGFLERIVAPELPPVLAPLMIGLVVIFLIFGAGTLLQYFSLLDFTATSILISLCAGVSIVCAFSYLGREKIYSAFASEMEVAQAELRQLSEALERFLAWFDNRMTKHKGENLVSCHYSLHILKQIEVKLHSRRKKIESCISAGGGNSLRDAWLLIRTPLIIRDSLVDEVGKSHHISLSRLNSVILPIMDQLEGRVLELDKHLTEKEQKKAKDEMLANVA